VPIETVCSSCSVKIKVRDELIGKAIKCPKCGSILAVPGNRDDGTLALDAVEEGVCSDSPASEDPSLALSSPDAAREIAPAARPAAAPRGLEATCDIAPGSRPAAVAAPEATCDIAPESRPADPAALAEPSRTEFLRAPDTDTSGTQALPSAGEASDTSGTQALSSAGDAMEAVASSDAHGAGFLQSLGGYRIVRELGQGGMGAVYEAEDIKLNRRVALKVMKPEIARKEHHRERFLREARTAAKVKSDFICPIYRVGEDNCVPFIAMPLLKGESLDVHWKQALRLPIDAVVRIGKEVAQGLSVAHDAGLIHRDIKPANIWLETQRIGPPRATILDFGLARMLAEDVHITQSGAILGTPAFMSPEQGRGDKHVDARTDLFSLGCVLYALSTGELPFKGDTTMGVLTALATHDPTPPHKISAAIPKPLSRLIMRLLAKKPDDRPQTAKEVIEELVEIEAAPASPAEETFTTQLEPPDASAAAREADARGKKDGDRPAKRTLKRTAAPYVVFAVISVAMIVCVAPLAGLGLYNVASKYFGNQAPEVDLGPDDADANQVVPEPTGEVPAGWVAVKFPVINYSVAMPQHPLYAPGPGGQYVAKLPNGRDLILTTQRVNAAQPGGADTLLDQFTAGVGKGGPQFRGRVKKTSLGPYKGREYRLGRMGPKGPEDLYARMYVIGNHLVMLMGPADGLAPAPDTAAFFNSLKLGGRDPNTAEEGKQSVHEVGKGLELRGKLDNKTQTVVYRVKLAAGKNYVIDMVSADSKALDPYLVLTDGTGKDLAEDDDSGGGLNARINFRPDESATFRILATSFSGVGAFTLTVREAAAPSKKGKE
jgi:serine/threonine protein kinase